MSERTRSRSPRRRTDSGRESNRKPPGGFRWKEKRRDNDTRSELDEGRLERGYIGREGHGRLPQGKRDLGRDRDGRRDGDREQRYSDNDVRREKKEKKEKRKAPAPVQHSEPMITVIVNDRLGTKAAIPCLGSDPIKLFKAQVAARIGREPHEILLKRQGERPFKDQLTLADYGVSNGVQLDLEVGTGD